jgi:hypothetical protein
MDAELAFLAKSSIVTPLGAQNQPGIADRKQLLMPIPVKTRISKQIRDVLKALAANSNFLMF